MTNQEAKLAALNALREAMEDMVKLKKELARETKKGVHMMNYRDFQDTYLKLKQMISGVNRRLKDWENLLPEDEEGSLIYPVLGESGCEYIPVKFKEVLDDTACSVHVELGDDVLMKILL